MIKQLFYSETSAFTYLVADPKERRAFLVDPVKGEEKKYLELIKKNNYSLGMVADTHTHADHITATGDLQKLTGCEIAGSCQSKAKGITRPLKDGECFSVGQVELCFIATPGHTDDSGCFYVKGNSGGVLTGDTLLIGGCGRTDFQNGSARGLWHSLHDKLLSFPESLTVYPGHDYHNHKSSTIGREQHDNPRLQLGEEEFISLMQQLELAPPKYIDKAVPANLCCGRDS